MDKNIHILFGFFVYCFINEAGKVDANAANKIYNCVFENVNK